MLVRLLLLLAGFIGYAAMAQAQHDLASNASGATQAVAVERVVACGPNTDKKDPP